MRAGLAAYLPGRLQALRARPKLFVFLIAEQFRQVYLDRTARHPWRRAVSSELMEKGIYYPDCRLAASSFTATGLATLATGAYPSLHGIVADQWYDRTSGRTGQGPRRDAGGYHPGRRGGRAGARSHSRNHLLPGPESKGRPPLLAGHSRGQVFWMDNQGRFNTRGNAPEWLADI